MLMRYSIAFLALVVSAALVACDDDTSPQLGDVQVTYRIGSGSSTCEDVNIAFVRVYMMTSETTSEMDETFACDPDRQTVTLQDVPAGSYTVRVEGLNSANAIIYTGTSTMEIEVEADSTNGPVSVVLNQLRPAMLIWTGFVDPGGCSRAEVVDIVIRVYENGASLIYDETFECPVRLDDGLLIEGLSETSSYDLRIRGTNSNSEYTYEYNENGVTVSPGAPTEISAQLVECTGLCDEP
jgi:hypothetical protein